MVVERRVTPEDSAALAQQLRDAFRSTEDTIPLDWMGQPMLLERVSDVEFVLRPPAGGGENRVVLGTAPKPVGYPGALPYLPDEVAMFNTSGPMMTVTWWSMSDQSALFADLDRQCVEAGWEKQPEPAVPDAEVTRCMYRKADKLRYLMLSQGILSLAERPVRLPA